MTNFLLLIIVVLLLGATIALLLVVIRAIKRIEGFLSNVLPAKINFVEDRMVELEGKIGALDKKLYNSRKRECEILRQVRKGGRK